MIRRLMVAVTAGAALLVSAGPGADSAATANDGWQLRWYPIPILQGLKAFEGLEDDRRIAHGEGAPHVYQQGNAYRFDSHLVDRDGSDRMRAEVRGMRNFQGQQLEIRKDETWRISYQMYIPDTLDATGQFTHIWQMKTADTSPPVAQLTLPIRNGVPKIEARYWDLDSNVYPFATADLEPLQNKWITTTLEFKSADDGYFRWVLREGNRTIVDARVDHIDLWWSDEQYNRPKWGVYRSIRSTGLQDTYLLVRNLQAWQQGPATPPVVLPDPDRSPGAYEAERAGNQYEGAAEPVYCRICSGGRKVLLIGGNHYDFMTMRGIWSDTTATKQMTIHAVVNGTQTFSISVNGGDAIPVTMTGTKDVITTATIPVPLINGVNHIRFYNLSARTPELDKIVIS